MKHNPLYQQINRLANGQRRQFDQLTADAEFSGAQARVLHYLLNHPDQETFQKDLEEEFGLRPSTATALLQGMEQKGLIHREISRQDGRYKKLLPTPQAETYRGALFADLDELAARLRRSIFSEDLAVWQKVTEQMIENLK